MVAIITGSGLGLERSSAWVLGSRGQLGQAAFGQNGENIYVNAANGNLAIRDNDEMLLGLGPDDVVSRSYNSEGALTGETDNWTTGLARSVGSLTGTRNTTGSTVTRRDWDGSSVIFAWDGAEYQSTAGGGPYDKISFLAAAGGQPDQWVWTDGASQTTEHYDCLNGGLDQGHVTSEIDTAGNALTFSYSGGYLASVTTQDGEQTNFIYTGSLLTQVQTLYHDEGGAAHNLSRVYYGYDGYSRLTSVTIDLTPVGSDRSDGVTYVTNYSYVNSTSKLISAISQSDGSNISFTYDSNSRVSSFTQSPVSGDDRTTTIDYPSNGQTIITDPLGQATTIDYYTTTALNGQLKKLTLPVAATGALQQVISFNYDANGNVTSIVPSSGDSISYVYNSSNGNRLTEIHTTGHAPNLTYSVIRRTYDAKNALLAETIYRTPATLADGSDAADPVTTRYVYDAQEHLRFTISGSGEVTRYDYNGPGVYNGTLKDTIQYTAATLDLTPYSGGINPTESDMVAWVSGQDKAAVLRSDMTYDHRGALRNVTSYEAVLGASGEGDVTRDVSTTTYVYDQAGNLISKTLVGVNPTYSPQEIYLYDGLGRMTGWTDALGNSTTITFRDSAGKTIVTVADGMTQTSIYDDVGELISYTQSSSDASNATKRYQYDADGQLRVLTDETGLSTYYLYDHDGRQVAEILADGTITEKKYARDGEVIATVAYASKLSSLQLASLTGPDGLPSTVGLDTAGFRPTGTAADRWGWRIYDDGNQLVETIDAEGGAVVYSYDGAGELTSTTAYANLLSSSQLTGFKSSSPSVVTRPTANAADDRVTRNFYDKEGRLVGSLDGAGYVTQTFYDHAGQKVETVAYGQITNAGHRAAGSFATLVADANATWSGSGPDSRLDDIHNYFVYDARGLLRATIDGEGDLTRYDYSILGFLIKVTKGEIDAITPGGQRPTLDGLPTAPAGAVLDVTTYVHDLDGLIHSETHALASGTESVVYQYDNMRRLVSTTTTGSTITTGTLTRRYDLRGHLIGELSTDGTAALAALVNPTASQVNVLYLHYGTTYDYDLAGRVISKTTPNGFGGAANKTLFFYDNDGRLTYEVDGASNVTRYAYDTFGEVSDTYAYNSILGSTTLSGGLADSTTIASLVSGIADVKKDSHSHLDYNVTGTLQQSVTDLYWTTASPSALVAATTSYGYNAFGQKVSSTTPLQNPDGTASTVTESWLYSRRGLLASSAIDTAGQGALNLVTSYAYDAFGRMTRLTDPSTSASSTTYDRAGRVSSTTDNRGYKTSFFYDGRGNTVKVTDPMGASTTYAYTQFDRTVTVTTPEGIQTKTFKDARGQTTRVTVIGQADHDTTYVYDGDGRLVSTTIGGQLSATQDYDQAGRLWHVVDANLTTTTYTYNGADRVHTRAVDPAGLNLTTTYTYDGKGQQVQVTDPTLSKTTISFDLAGRKTTMVVDDGGKNLTTTYTYDPGDRLMSVTQASGTTAATTTTYAYDKADRLITAVVDAGASPHLNLTTSYAYDRDDNVVAKTDANMHVTHYIYSANNQLVYSIDAEGDVTNNLYDADGRLVSVRNYFNQISATALAAMPAQMSTSDVTGAISMSGNDHITRYAYNTDGRLRYTIDATGLVTELNYDKIGNVVRQTQYFTSIAPTDYAYASVQDAIVPNTNDRVSRFVYDGANRLAYTIDATGAVTAYARDGAGNVVTTTRYQAGYAADPVAIPALAAMQSWATANASAATADAADSDRVERTFYDTAGRAVYVADQIGFVTEGGVRKPTYYITEQQFDSDGRVFKQIRYASAYKIVSGASASDVEGGVLPATVPTTAAVTNFGYDTAGRLTDVTNQIDATHSTTTHTDLDALGQALSTTVAYNTADASVTQRLFDGAGRLKSETRASGPDDASETHYEYDGIGNLTSIAGPEGASTTRIYDAAGRLTDVKTLLSGSGLDAVYATTHNDYDNFGNVIKVTDPMHHVGVFYYDKLNRQILQVDPLGFATATSYSLGGQVTNVKHYFVAVAAVDAANPNIFPTLSGAFAETKFTRDELDRVTQTTDAENNSETYVLNAFGDRLQVTNKLNGVTYNTFDMRGLLTSELLPEAASYIDAGGVIHTRGTGNIKNTYTYDARGNLTDAVEASGLPEQRTTHYDYDLLDRVISKTGDVITVTNSQTFVDGGTTVPPVETTTYDLRGNVISFKDANGGYTYSYYDSLSRKTEEVDAAGAIHTWTYYDNGNVKSAQTYTTPVTPPSSRPETAPPPAYQDTFRLTTYEYDANGRLITTRIKNVLTGEMVGTTYQTTTNASELVTKNVYDSNGNIIQNTDANLNNTFNYYDAAGHMVGTVDAAGYFTSYALDADGNIQTETRYADVLTTTVTAATTLGAIQTDAGNGVHADDRITSFLYDKNGRRLSESRLNVSYQTIDASGVATSHLLGVATVNYTYNGLGEVLTKQEATGDTTTYTYDHMGRQTRQSQTAITDYTGTSSALTTETTYDGLNNASNTRTGRLSLSTFDRITTYAYGAGGRLASVTDANGDVRSYGYDLNGNVLRESFVRTHSDGTTETDANLYGYDAMGRLNFQSAATKNGATWVRGDQTKMQYNAFGDMVAKGVHATWIPASTYQETYKYDNAGRLWSTNSGDGVLKFYAHDANGNVTLTMTSSGVFDLSPYTTIGGVIAAADGNDISKLNTVHSDFITVTIDMYDGRNQNVENQQVLRELDQTASHDVTLSTKRDYNAFGEVKKQTDAMGYFTTYEYNTEGRLTKTTSPSVNIGFADGTNQLGTPIQAYAYDISGRLVAVMDANNHLTTRQLLANHGYNGQEAVVLSEFHQDRGIVISTVDVFGDVHSVKTNDAATGLTVGGTEVRTYDDLGQLISVTHPASDSGANLIDSYTYDEQGQRLTHTNNMPTQLKETTDYDVQGRVTKVVDPAGVTTTYGYAFDGSIATNGLGSFGGWTKTTILANALSSTQTIDYFGRSVGETDFGGHVTTTAFDEAGRLASKTVAGALTSYVYYDTGGLASINAPGNAVSTYSYDRNGNKKTDVFKVGSTIYRNATATYDELNRLTGVNDAGPSEPMSVAYTYDAVGNVRHMVSSFRPVDGTTVGDQDYWYAYDTMNRFTVTEGMLNGTTIGRTAQTDTEHTKQGITLTYDVAGRRTSATQWAGRPFAVTDSTGVTRDINGTREEDYTYSADGYLNGVSVKQSTYKDYFDGVFDRADGPARTVGDYTRDLMGRITEDKEYDDSSRLVYDRHGIGYDANGNVAGIGYDADGNVTGDTVDTTAYTTVGQNERVTTSSTSNVYDYGINTSGGVTSYAAYVGGAVVGQTVTTVTSQDGGTATTVHSAFANSYSWWDSAQQQVITYTADTVAQPTVHNTTTYNYAAEGTLNTIGIVDGRPRTETYVTDSNGEIISRKESTSTDSSEADNPTEFDFYFDGVKIGTTGNNGTFNSDYVSGVAQRNAAVQSGTYQFGAHPAADFDQSYDAITPTTQATADATYVVKDGDTLQSIAQAVWGDGAMWYLLADANGLSDNASLAPGVTLRVPAKVTNIHNNSDTFRPYDPNKAIGSVSPTAPKPVAATATAAKHGCGIVGEILVIAVAVAVAVATHGAAAHLAGALINLAFGYGAATTAVGAVATVVVGGAIAGAAGSAVSQGVGIAIGQQSGFSWKGVALAAVAGAIGAGLKLGPMGKIDGAVGSTAGNIIGGAARGVVGSALTQGVAVATGLQNRFDWTGVAVAGVAGGVVGGLNLPQGTTFGDKLINGFVSGAAGDIAGAAVRSVFEGSDFGDNLLKGLPDVIGVTIGNAVGSSLTSDNGGGNFGQPSRGMTPLGEISLNAADVGSPEVDGDVGPLVSLGESMELYPVQPIQVTPWPQVDLTQPDSGGHLNTTLPSVWLSGGSGAGGVARGRGASARDVGPPPVVYGDDMTVVYQAVANAARVTPLAQIRPLLTADNQPIAAGEITILSNTHDEYELRPHGTDQQKLIYDIYDTSSHRTVASQEALPGTYNWPSPDGSRVGLIIEAFSQVSDGLPDVAEGERDRQYDDAYSGNLVSFAVDGAPGSQFNIGYHAMDPVNVINVADGVRSIPGILTGGIKLGGSISTFMVGANKAVPRLAEAGGVNGAVVGSLSDEVAALQNMGSVQNSSRMRALNTEIGWGSDAPGPGFTVLGRNPDYISMAEEIGARRFDVPDAFYPQQGMAANLRFVDRSISRGDTFKLSNPPSSARPGGGFDLELQYLGQRGYVPNADGTSLLPPGGGR